MDWSFDWAEALALPFLALGFIAGLFAESPGVMYAATLLVGFVLGRVWFLQEGRGRVLVFLGVLAYWAGVFFWWFWADTRIVVVVLLVGMWLGFMGTRHGLLKAAR